MLAALLTVAAASAPDRPTGGGGEGGGGGDNRIWPGGALPSPPPTTFDGATHHYHHHHRRLSTLYAINQRHRRQISSATDLRFLHIPRDMAEPMIPDIGAYQVDRPGRKKAPIRLTVSSRPVFVSQVVLLGLERAGKMSSQLSGQIDLSGVPPRMK